ncbi:acidic endochitinase SE2 [Lactuca sativa]|uniref:acidic endochitinase SE2 n=1 Tax=Lactuca sativa TaxID=4236 RepID=UPI001C688CE5|nr:acidic endochitinase SE2 [Lactuca sativa]
MVSINSKHAHALLLLISINLAFFFFPVHSQSSPNISIGIDNEGLFVYVFSVAAVVQADIPASNVQTTSLQNPAGTDHRDSAATCSGLIPDIRACQSQGVKVFLSLDGSYSVSQDAQQFSDYIWNTFLGGQSSSRPFGDVVFDGINFNIEAGSGSGQFWADVATSLKVHSSSSQAQLQKKLYLSAAVPCLFPADAHLGVGLFDYVWVRFYNNRQCEYGANAVALLAAWNRWTAQVTSSRIFLGLPAAPAGAALSGYIPADLLTLTVLPFIKTSPKYAGVMLWNTFYDQQTGYSAAIKNSV